MKCELCGNETDNKAVPGVELFEHAGEEIGDYLVELLKSDGNYTDDENVHKFLERFETEFLTNLREIYLCDACQNDKNFKGKIDELCAKEAYEWLKKCNDKILNQTVLDNFKSGEVKPFK